MQLRVRLLTPGAKAPARGSAHAAGFDLTAVLDRTVTLVPGETALVSTGIAVEIPAGHFGLVKDRSSLALKGLRTSAGVIDSDYRGEVKVVLTNASDEPREIEPGTRIAQMLVLPHASPEVVEVDALEDTERGAGGFGSTGTT
ncbi:dUTP diphosphatase [Candidatus Poribacteria bacterium]|jgi:dUTP pyrophosphatase|nr:dUTP diphosphatase [Candidatus Poribacteria bacterium]MBT5535642.1 dUTP diphosphatase [Candidatus Poribacteria bacterium]MBT7099559.1 dUTP diphosphatase [Candidatus Poribacteria bacterium]MBT7805586.1 dUTP diphosphatase [Candidatus Poribacteria bacterium]